MTSQSYQRFVKERPDLNPAFVDGAAPGLPASSTIIQELIWSDHFGQYDSEAESLVNWTISGPEWTFQPSDDHWSVSGTQQAVSKFSRPLTIDAGVNLLLILKITGYRTGTFSILYDDQVAVSGIAADGDFQGVITTTNPNGTVTVEASDDGIGQVSYVSAGLARAYEVFRDAVAGPVTLPTIISAEAQAVLDRMSALSSTEINAIIAYVDGMVAAGYYTDITEIYAPCLNGTDYHTGFKFMTLIDSSPAAIHTPGEYVDFTTSSRHMLDSANFDSFASIEGFVGAYIVFTDADVTQNSDLFGVADASGRECYMRWRGNDTNDFNTLYCVTSASPRTVANVRPSGDLVGFGLEGVEVYNLGPGGIISKATRIQEGIPTTHPFQWHGQNLSGTPALGNVQPSRYSLMIHSNAIISTIAQGSLRALSLQFLRDIGVTGIPAT